jgi:hypothetical protein
VCPPTSQANQGFARTDAVCPLNRHPSIWQTSGSLLPRILKSQICRSRSASPSNSERAFMAGPHPPRPILARLGVLGGAGTGVSRRGSILATATASYDATFARPARGRREVAITAAPDMKERTRQPWFAIGFF